MAGYTDIQHKLEHTRRLLSKVNRFASDIVLFLIGIETRETYDQVLQYRGLETKIRMAVLPRFRLTMIHQRQSMSLPVWQKAKILK